MSGAYYNENDKQAANWLRELINEGLIAPGVVDDRSIHEIEPRDLRGFAQCHFFAGIGVWSHALRRAGWADDEPIWTGSCPCQPFSTAGKGEGFNDTRHLWPIWFRLIRECGPRRVLGEQVDAAVDWIDLVSADLESGGYAFGAADLPAAGFGGAHIRQRLYWVADANNTQWWADRAPWHDGEWPQTGRVKSPSHAGGRGQNGGLAYSDSDGWSARGGRGPLWPERDPQHGSEPGGLGNAGRNGSPSIARDDGEMRGLSEAEREPEQRPPIPGGPSGAERLEITECGGRQGRRTFVRWTGSTLSSGSADWLFCRDGSWRPVEPGSSPLVDEAPARVATLRGYGNAIDAETATNFIAAYMAAAPAFGRAA